MSPQAHAKINNWLLLLITILVSVIGFFGNRSIRQFDEKLEKVSDKLDATNECLIKYVGKTETLEENCEKTRTDVDKNTKDISELILTRYILWTKKQN